MANFKDGTLFTRWINRTSATHEFSPAEVTLIVSGGGYYLNEVKPDGTKIDPKDVKHKLFSGDVSMNKGYPSLEELCAHELKTTEQKLVSLKATYDDTKLRITNNEKMLKSLKKHPAIVSLLKKKKDHSK